MEEGEAERKNVQPQNESLVAVGVAGDTYTSGGKNDGLPAVRKSSRPRKQSKRVLDSADCEDEEIFSVPVPKKHKSQKKDYFSNGQPFKCSLCKSVHINNCSSRTKLKTQNQPVRKEKDGKILHLCVKCALAVGQTESKGPTSEQRAEFEAEGKKFALHLVESLGDSEATRLYCSFYQLVKCGCLQNYIEGKSLARKRKTSLSGTDAASTEKLKTEEEPNVPVDNASRLERGRFFLDLLKTAQTKKKAYSCKKSRNRNSGTEETERDSKVEFEKFLLVERVKLKKMGICERGCQKVLCYSNNFLHKKSSKNEANPRIQRTKGRAALGRLDALSELSKMICCDKMCVKMAEENLDKLEKWRSRAQGSQKEMWQVIHEMLSPADEANSICQKFISMVTGRCMATVQKVYGQSLLSKGKAGKREHGLKHHWKKQRELIQTLSSTSSTSPKPLKRYENNIFILSSAASPPTSNPTGSQKLTRPPSQLPEAQSPLAGSQLLVQHQKPAVDPAKQLVGQQLQPAVGFANQLLVQQPTVVGLPKQLVVQQQPAGELTKQLVCQQQPALDPTKNIFVQQQPAVGLAKQLVVQHQQTPGLGKQLLVQKAPQIPGLQAAHGVLTYIQTPVQALTAPSHSVPSVSAMVSVTNSVTTVSSKMATSFIPSQAEHSSSTQQVDSRQLTSQTSQQEYDGNHNAEPTEETGDGKMSQEVENLQGKIGELKVKEKAVQDEMARLCTKLNTPQAIENLKEHLNHLSEIQRDLKALESQEGEFKSSLSQRQTLPESVAISGGTMSSTASQREVSTAVDDSVTSFTTITSTSTMQDSRATSAHVSKIGRPSTSKTSFVSQPVLETVTKNTSQSTPSTGHLNSSQKEVDNIIPSSSVHGSAVSLSLSMANSRAGNVSAPTATNWTPQVISLPQGLHGTNQNPSMMPQVFSAPVTGLQQMALSAGGTQIDLVSLSLPQCNSTLSQETSCQSVATKSTLSSSQSNKSLLNKHQFSMPQILPRDNYQVNLMTPTMQQSQHSSLKSSQPMMPGQMIISHPLSHSDTLTSALSQGCVVTVSNISGIEGQQLNTNLQPSSSAVSTYDTVLHQGSDCLPTVAIQKGTPTFDPSQQTQILTFSNSGLKAKPQMPSSSAQSVSHSAIITSDSNCFQDLETVPQVSNSDQNLQPSLLTLLPSSVPETQPHSSGYLFDALADSPIKDPSFCPPISQPVPIVTQSLSNPKSSLLCEMLMSPTGPPFCAISTPSSLQSLTQLSSSPSSSMPIPPITLSESQKNNAAASSISVNLDSLPVYSMPVPHTGISYACQSLNFETSSTPSAILTQPVVSVNNTESQVQGSGTASPSGQNMPLTQSLLKVSRSQRTRELQIGIVHPHVAGGIGDIGKKPAACSSTNSNNYSRFSLGNVPDTQAGTSHQLQSFSELMPNGQTNAQRCLPNVQAVGENQSHKMQLEVQQEHSSSSTPDHIPIGISQVSHPSQSIQTSLSGLNTEIPGSVTQNISGMQNVNTFLQSIQNLPNIIMGGGLQSSGHQVFKLVVSPGTGNIVVEPMALGSSNSLGSLPVPQNNNSVNITLPASVGNDEVQNRSGVSTAIQNKREDSLTVPDINFSNASVQQGNVSAQPVVVNSLAVPQSSAANGIQFVSASKPLTLPFPMKNATTQPSTVNSGSIQQNNIAVQPMGTNNITAHQLGSRDVTVQKSNVPAPVVDLNNASFQGLVLNNAMFPAGCADSSTAQSVLNSQTIVNLPQNSSVPIFLQNFDTHLTQIDAKTGTELPKSSSPFPITANVKPFINSGPNQQQRADSFQSSNSSTVPSSVSRFEPQTSTRMAREKLDGIAGVSGTFVQGISSSSGKTVVKESTIIESNVGISAEPTDLVALLNQTGNGVSNQHFDSTSSQIAQCGPRMVTVLASQHQSPGCLVLGQNGRGGSASQLPGGIIQRPIALETPNVNQGIVEGIQVVSASHLPSQQLLPIQVLDLGQIQSGQNSCGQILEVRQDASFDRSQLSMQTLGGCQQVLSLNNSSTSSPVFSPLQSVFAQPNLDNTQGLNASQQMNPVILTPSTCVSTGPGASVVVTKTRSAAPQVTKNTATPVTFTSAQPTVANSEKQITSTASSSNKHRLIRPKLAPIASQVKPTVSTQKSSFILVPDKPGFPTYQLGDIDPSILSSLVANGQNLQLQPVQQQSQTCNLNIGIQTQSSSKSSANIKPNSSSVNPETQALVSSSQSVEGNKKCTASSGASSSVLLVSEQNNLPNGNKVISHSRQSLNLQQLCIQNETVQLGPQQTNGLGMTCQPKILADNVLSSCVSSDTTTVETVTSCIKPVSNGTFQTNNLSPQVSLLPAGSSHVTLLNLDPTNLRFAPNLSSQTLSQDTVTSLQRQVLEISSVKLENKQFDGISNGNSSALQWKPSDSNLSQPKSATPKTSLSHEILPKANTPNASYPSMLPQKASEIGQGTTNLFSSPGHQIRIVPSSQFQNGAELHLISNGGLSGIATGTPDPNSSGMRLVTAELENKRNSVRIDELATSVTQPISILSLSSSSHPNQTIVNQSCLPGVETISTGDQTQTKSSQLMLHLSKPVATPAGSMGISQQQDCKDNVAPISYLQCKEVIDLTNDSPPVTPIRNQRPQKPSAVLMKPAERQAPQSTLLYEELQKNSQNNLAQTDASRKTIDPISHTYMLQTVEQAPHEVHQVLKQPEQPQAQQYQMNPLIHQHSDLTSGEVTGANIISVRCESQGSIRGKDLRCQGDNTQQNTSEDHTIGAPKISNSSKEQGKQNSISAVLSQHCSPKQATAVDIKSSDNTKYQIACQSVTGDGASNLITLDEMPEDLRQDLIASLEAHAAGNPDVHLETRTLNQSDDISCHNIFHSTGSSHQAELQLNEISKAIGNSKCPSAVVTISANQRFKQSLGKIKSQAVLDTKTSLASEIGQGHIMGANTSSIKSDSNPSQLDMVFSSSAVGLPVSNQILLHNVSVPSPISSISSSTSQILLASSAAVTLGQNVSTHPVNSSTIASPAVTVSMTISNNTSTNRPTNTPVTSAPVTFLRATNTPTDAVGPPNITIMPSSVTNAAHLLRLGSETNTPLGSITSNTLTSGLNVPLMVQPASQMFNPKTATFTLPGTVDSQNSTSAVKQFLLPPQNSSTKIQSNADAMEKTSNKSSQPNLLLTLVKGPEGQQSRDLPPRKKERKRPSTIRDLVNKEAKHKAAAAAAQICPTTSVVGPVTYVLSRSAGTSGLLVMNPPNSQDAADKNLLDVTVKNVQFLTRGINSSKDEAVSLTEVNTPTPPSGFTLLQPSTLQLLKEEGKPNNLQEKQNLTVSQPAGISAHSVPIILEQCKDQSSLITSGRSAQSTQQLKSLSSVSSVNTSGSISSPGIVSVSNIISTPLVINMSSTTSNSDNIMVKDVPIPSGSQPQGHVCNQSLDPQYLPQKRNPKPQTLIPVSVSMASGPSHSSLSSQSIVQDDKCFAENKNTERSSQLIGQPGVSIVLADSDISVGQQIAMNWSHNVEAVSGEKLKFKTALKSGNQILGSQIYKFHLPGESQKEGQACKQDGQRNEMIRSMLSLNKNNSPVFERKNFPSTLVASSPVVDSKEGPESNQQQSLSQKCPSLLRLMKSKSTDLQSQGSGAQTLLGQSSDKQLSLRSKVRQSPYSTEHLLSMNEVSFHSDLHSDNRPAESKDGRRETAQVLFSSQVQADKTSSAGTSVPHTTKSGHLYNRDSQGDERKNSLPYGSPMSSKTFYTYTSGNISSSPTTAHVMKSSHLEKQKLKSEKRMDNTVKTNQSQGSLETKNFNSKTAVDTINQGLTIESRKGQDEKEKFVEFSSIEKERRETPEHLHPSSIKAAYSDTDTQYNQFPSVQPLPPRYEVAARELQRLESSSVAHIKRPPPDYEDISRLQNRVLEIKRPKLSLDVSTIGRGVPDNSQSRRIGKVIDDIYRFPDEGEEPSPPPTLSGSKFQPIAQKLKFSYPPCSQLGNVVEESEQTPTHSHSYEGVDSTQKQKFYRNISENLASSPALAGTSDMQMEIREQELTTRASSQAWKYSRKGKTSKQTGKSNSRFNPKKVQFSDVVTAQEFRQPMTGDVPVSQGFLHVPQNYALEAVQTIPDRVRALQPKHHHGHYSEDRHHSPYETSDRHPDKHQPDRPPLKSKSSKLKALLSSQDDSSYTNVGDVLFTLHRDAPFSNSCPEEQQHGHSSSQINTAQHLQSEDQERADQLLSSYREPSGERNNDSLGFDTSGSSLGGSRLLYGTDRMLSEEEPSQSGVRSEVETSNQHSRFQLIPQSRKSDVTNSHSLTNERDALDTKLQVTGEQLRQSYENVVVEDRVDSVLGRQDQVRQATHLTSSLNTNRELPLYEVPSSFHILSTQGYSKLSRQRLARMPSDQSDDLTPTSSEPVQVCGPARVVSQTSSSSDRLEAYKNQPYQQAWDPSSDSSSSYTAQSSDDREPTQFLISRHKLLESDFELAQQMSQGFSHGMVTVSKEGRMDGQDETNKHIFHPVRRQEGSSATSLKDMEWIQDTGYGSVVNDFLVLKDSECRNLPGMSSKLSSPIFSEQVESHAGLEPVEDLGLNGLIPSHLRKEICDYLKENQKLKKEISVKESAVRENQRQRQLSASDKLRGGVGDTDDLDRAYISSPLGPSSQMHALENTSSVQQRKKHPSSSTVPVGILKYSPSPDEMLKIGEGVQVRSRHPSSVSQGIRPLLEQDNSWSELRVRSNTIGTSHLRNSNYSHDPAQSEISLKGQRDPLVSGTSFSRPSSQMDMEPVHYESTRHRFPSSDLKLPSSRLVPEGDILPLGFEISRHRNLSSALGGKLTSDLEPPPYDSSQRQRNPSSSSLKSTFDFDFSSFDFGTRSRNPSSSSWLRSNFMDVLTDSSFTASRSRNPSGSSNRRSRPGSSSSDRELPISVDELPFFSDIAHTRSRNSSGDSIEPTIFLDRDQILQLYPKQNRH